VSELPTVRSTGLFARVEDGVVTLAALGVMSCRWRKSCCGGSSAPGIRARLVHVAPDAHRGLVGAAIAPVRASCSPWPRQLAPEGRLRDVAKVISALVGSMVSTVLALGGMQLLQVHRDAAKPIALGIPVWVVDWRSPSPSA